MAKKKKAKSSKKVAKKTPVKKTKKKISKKIAKKVSAKSINKKSSKKKTTKKVVKKMAANKVKVTTDPKVKKRKTIKLAEVSMDKDIKVKPVKAPRKKRITKAETLRLMQQEQLVKKWHSLHKKIDKMDTVSYNMRERFAEETAISHIKLGWGFILSNTNDRLEVLFEDGIKNLISNYKS